MAECGEWTTALESPEPEKLLAHYVATANAVGRRRRLGKAGEGGARHPGLGPTSQV